VGVFTIIPSVTQRKCVELREAERLLCFFDIIDCFGIEERTLEVPAIIVSYVFSVLPRIVILRC